MSISLALSVVTNFALSLVSDLGSNAVLEIRTGAPAGPDNAAGGTLLVSVPIGGAWSVNGGGPHANHNVFAGNPNAVLPTAAGTAGHFRLKTSGGAAILEGTITATGGGGDLELSSTSILMGQQVDLDFPSFVLPLG